MVENSISFINKLFVINYLTKKERKEHVLLFWGLSGKNEGFIKLRKKHEVYLGKDLYLKRQPNSFFFLNEIRKVLTPVEIPPILDKLNFFYFREETPATRTSFFYFISDIEEESGINFLTTPFLWLGFAEYFFLWKNVNYFEIDRTQIGFKIEMFNDIKKILPTNNSKKEKINFKFLKKNEIFFPIFFEFFSEIKSICSPKKDWGPISESFSKYQKLFGFETEILRETLLKNSWENIMILSRKYSSKKIGLGNRIGQNLIIHQKWDKTTFRYFCFFEKKRICTSERNIYPLIEKKFLFPFSGFISSKLGCQNSIKIGKGLFGILLTCDNDTVPFKMLVLIDCNFSKSDWLLNAIERKKDNCNFQVIFKNLNNDFGLKYIRELTQELKTEGFQTIILIANFEILILSKLLSILSSLSLIQLSKFFAGVDNSVLNKKKKLLFFVKGSKFSFFGIPLDVIQGEFVWAHRLKTERKPVRVYFFFRNTEQASVITIDFTMFFFFTKNDNKNKRLINYLKEKDLKIKKRNSMYFFSILVLFRWISGLIIEKNFHGKERVQLLKFCFIVIFLVNNYIENQKK